MASRRTILEEKPAIRIGLCASEFKDLELFSRKPLDSHEDHATLVRTLRRSILQERTPNLAGISPVCSYSRGTDYQTNKQLEPDVHSSSLALRLAESRRLAHSAPYP